MFGKPSTPNAAALYTCTGILFGGTLCYLLLSLPTFLQDGFYFDFELAGFLAIIGLFVVAYSWYENRTLYR